MYHSAVVSWLMLLAEFACWCCWQLRQQFTELQNLQKGLLEREGELDEKMKLYEDRLVAGQQAQGEVKRQMTEMAALRQEIQDLTDLIKVSIELYRADCSLIAWCSGGSTTGRETVNVRMVCQVQESNSHEKQLRFNRL